jgi:hypothetical protein
MMRRLVNAIRLFLFHPEECRVALAYWTARKLGTTVHPDDFR